MNDEKDKSLVHKEASNTTNLDNAVFDDDIKGLIKRFGELARIEEKKVEVEERKVDKYSEIQVRQINSENELGKLRIKDECDHKKRKDENETLRINTIAENEKNIRKLILQLVWISVGLTVFIIILVIGFLVYLVYSGKDTLTDKVLTTLISVLGGGGIVAAIIAALSTVIRIIKNRNYQGIEEDKKQLAEK